MGSVDTPGDARTWPISGTHAYVADGDSGLQVIDITDPASPQIVGSVDTPGSAEDVAVSGTHAYVADDAFRSPGDRHHESRRVPRSWAAWTRRATPMAWPSRAPTPTSRTTIVRSPGDRHHESQSPQIVGSVDTPDPACGVAVSGTYAYVADAQLRSPGDRHHESRRAPRSWAAWTRRAMPMSVAVSGTHAYVADCDVRSPGDRHRESRRAPRSWAAWTRRAMPTAWPSRAPTPTSRTGTSGLQVIDIANPAESPDRGQRGHAGRCLGRGRLGHPRLCRGRRLRSPGDRHHESREPADRGQRGHAGLCLWRGRLGHPRLRRGLRHPVSR